MSWDIRAAKRIKDKIESKIHTNFGENEADEDNESGRGYVTEVQGDDDEASHGSYSNVGEHSDMASRHQGNSQPGAISSANKRSKGTVNLPPPPTPSISLSQYTRQQSSTPSRKQKNRSPAKISIDIAVESSRQTKGVNEQATDFMGRLVESLERNHAVNLVLVQAIESGTH